MVHLIADRRLEHGQHIGSQNGSKGVGAERTGCHAEEGKDRTEE